MDDTVIEKLLQRAPHTTQQELLANPRFPAARRLYLDRFVDLYGQDPFLVRLLIETGRFLVFHLAVVLAASHDPAQRETWFTVGRLKRQMAMFGIGTSDRHIDYLVARLRATGFMEIEVSPQDRRLRILRPTEAMLAHDRDWIAAHYAPLALLNPHNDYSLALRRDPAFQIAQRRVSFDFMPLGLKLLLSEPDMLLFFQHAAGHMILAALLQTASNDPDQLNAAVPYQEVGARFGVSRTHVRQLLAAAEQAGLVKLLARGGQRVEILPRLWQSYDRSIAGGMFLHDLLYGTVTSRQPSKRG